MKNRILVVDDEKIKLITLLDALSKEGYEAEGAEDGMAALKKLEESRFDIVVADLKLPKMDGMELLKHVKEKYQDTEVIIMTAYGTIESAVSAMKIGAHDYLTKPFPTEELLLKVQRLIKYQALAKENILLHNQLDERYGIDNIIGKNKRMQEIYELIKTIAPGESNVVIYGESGTGKELVTHAIHHNSLRKNGPFIKVSCATLSESILESELFGHEKGAFTGALNRKPGRFELADGGTIFLDDVDDMSPLVQVKILRVLQEREFERVGGTETVKVNVRVVAASKKDLGESVKTGKFREDLYYRLNVIAIHLPPLRERKDDVPLLVYHFLKKYAVKSGKKIEEISPDALSRMLEYNWPGNIRELENAIERAVALSRGIILTVKDLPTLIAQGEPQMAITEKSPTTIEGIVKDAEKEHIIRILRETGGKKNETAKILGISRKTLWEKMKLYKLG